ncbi:DUF4097 family beta strand repeat-containing protein [Streptomyces sp. NPDC101733]|uniref:DUF4097 family beta strand repeat-containing protein n=1 Tax=unclassified Streptomyces TaxID=2593676 RepID=UPI003439CD4C
MKRPFRTKPAVYALAVVISGGLLSGCVGSTTTDSASYTVDSAVTSLKVNASGGTIEVVVGGGGSVKVTENLKYDGDKPRTSHSENGGELTLTAPKDCGGSGIGGSTCQVDYRVEVPKALAATLDSDGGAIVVEQAVAGRLTARSDGGKVTAGFSEAPDSVDINSAGGNVTLRLPDSTYAVDASSDGGNQSVRVRTAPDSPRKIRARTDGGAVQVLPGT